MRNFANRAAAAAFTLIIAMGSAVAAEGANSMDTATETKLKGLLDGAQRSADNKARDTYRHPLETLKFFGLKQDMAVMEIWPAGGWWTEILAPLLADQGRYVAGHFDPNGPAYFAKSLASFKDKMAKDPAHYGKVEIVSFTPEASVPAGSLDMVLTFRNIHNWMGQGQEKAMAAAMHQALKPGGYLGVVEHRAATDAPQDPKAASGYVREDFAISLFEGAGFKLVSKSEVNANPKDTKDYPGGVWTLPPNYREGDKDRAKYQAIGESDRFTLLFQKAE